jgi:hypothetical protein
MRLSSSEMDEALLDTDILNEVLKSWYRDLRTCRAFESFESRANIGVALGMS